MTDPLALIPRCAYPYIFDDDTDPADLAALLKACVALVSSEYDYEPPKHLKPVWLMVKQQIEDMLEKRTARAEAGSKGGKQTQANASKAKQPQANASSDKQIQARSSLTKQNKTKHIVITEKEKEKAPSSVSVSVDKSKSSSSVSGKDEAFDQAVDYAAISNPNNDPVKMAMKLCGVSDQLNRNVLCKYRRLVGDWNFRATLSGFYGEMNAGEVPDNPAAAFTKRLVKLAGA